MNKSYLYINRKEFRWLPLIVLVIYLLLFSAPMSGQSINEIKLDMPQVVPVSPAVSEMEKYQSYPVSHCTGIPDITIPLYEIVAGEVTIPVTLSYHSSGLKPKEKSGVAGTGWMLNLEPSISRQINGSPDEKYNTGWFYTRYIQPPWQWEDLLWYYDRKISGALDSRPDKFIYKLPHGGGSGYFQNQSSPLWTVPRNNDKVIFNHDYSMDITDENGVKYYFGEAYEKTGDDVTRWLCSSICSARHQGQQLATFSYLPPRYHMNPSNYYNLNGQITFTKRDSWNKETLLMIGSNPYRVQPGTTTLPNGIKEATWVSITNAEAGIDISEPSHYTSGDVSTTLLSEVNFLGNNLSVSYKVVGSNNTTFSDVLDEIQVRDDKNILIRSIKFYITPYNNNTSLTKLDSVRISSPGDESRVWTFSYSGSGSVPSIYTTAVDHWGFFNGDRNGSSNNHPSIQEIVSLDMNGFSNMQDFMVNYKGADRSPNFEYTDTGILYQITDPQGIRISFSYEGNYGAFRDTNKNKANRDYLHPVGGLRVSNITTYDPHTKKRIRKIYKYGLTNMNISGYEPIWGGGAIEHIVTQRDYCSKTMAVFKDPQNNHMWKDEMTTYSSMPVSNICLFNGSPVMYNVVSETVLGDDNTQTKTIYYYDVKYHEFEDILEWDDDDPAGSVEDFVTNSITDKTKYLVRTTPYLSNGPKGDFINGRSNQLYGALLRTDYYRDHELVASIENSYSKKEYGSCQIQILIPERYLVSDWNTFSGSIYDNGNNSIFNIHYEFLDVSTFRQLDKETSKRYYTSDGGLQQVVTTEKRYTYNFDPYDPGVSLKPRIVETTRSDNTQMIDTYDYLLGYPAILSSHKHTEGESSKESRVLFRYNSCLPQKVQSRTDKQINFQDEVVYRCYDDWGNVTEISGKDGTPISFLWSYNSRFPVAQIENATIEQVCSALGIRYAEEWADCSAPDAKAWENINSLREKLPDSRVTTYEYAPLNGVITTVDPNGITNKFVYDGYSRLTDCYYLNENAHKVMLQKYVYNFGK